MLINNKVLFSVSNMIRTFEVLLISVFLSRFIINKNDLGELLQVIFISSICVTLISGLPLALNYFYGKYSAEEDKQSLFGKSLALVILVSFLLCLLIFLFKEVLGVSFKNILFREHIFTILLFLFFKCINTIFPNYYYLKSKLGKYLFLYTLTTSFLFGFFLYDYYAHSFINILIIKQLFYVELLRLIINIFLIEKKELNFKNGFFKKSELLYISTVSIGVSLGAFNLYIDKYLIAVLLNPTEFVFYQNGAINLPFVNIITSSLFIALIPVFTELYTKGKFEELANETKKAILKCSLFLLPILIYCFFEAVPLIKIIYGETFEDSGKVFKIYILRYTLSVMAYSVYMGSIGLERRSNLIVLLSALIGLGLNLLLIPIYGIIGASWAIVISSLFTVFICFHYINKKLNIKTYDFFPIKEYLKILFISTVLYIPFHFLNFLIQIKEIVLLSSFVYYIIVLLTLNYFFKIFDHKKIINKI